MEKERFQNDINTCMQKIQRANTHYEASYNNVKQVRGEDFDNSAENMEVMAQVEGQKTQHLLSALSVIINEFPALGTVIRGSFGDEL